MKNSDSVFVRCIIVIGLMLLLPTQGLCDDDLWTMFELAKKKDPVLQKAQAQLQGALEDKNVTRSQLLPSVDAKAGANEFWHNVTGSGPSEIEGEFTGYNYSLMLRQPLIAGPQWANMSYSDSGIMLARNRLIVADQDLMVRVSEAYFAVLKARSDEQIATKENQLLTQILLQAKSFLQKGTGDVIAVYEAQARVDSSHAALIKAGNDRLVAEQKLAILTGLSSIRELAGLTAPAPAEPDPPSVDAWLEIATQSHPVIKEARESLHMAEYNLIGTKRLHWPTLDLTGGYTVNKGSAFLPEVATKQWVVGVNLTIPIFNGLGTEARVGKAQATVLEQKAAVTDSLEQVQFRTKSLYLSVKNSVAFISALEQQKHSAELQLMATKKGNSIGTRTIVDLLNAEQKYAAALRDLTSAGYDHLHFDILLHAAAGILAEDFLQKTNQMLSPTTKPQ